MVKKAGQKRKKEEKSKTQLKKPKTGPGNHLPKGTNVTKTEFKVGKIVIPKQLDKSDGCGEAGPLTKRKLGLKDLLSKLSHYSQSVRFESLEGLRELVTGEFGGNLVNTNLSLMITRLAPLTSDRESRVRRTAFAILQAILGKVEESNLEPLFPVLTAHLSCCLTHIDPAIQQDGLTLIDTLVSSIPKFISSNFSRILPDCLEQISARKAGDIRKVGVSSQVSDKISSLQWRINVLGRVDKILDCIINGISYEPLNNGNSGKVLSFKEDLHVSLYPVQASALILGDLTKRSGEDPMLSIMDQIIPLILESWVEATSEGKKNSRIGFLSNEVFPLLEHICGILDKLVSYCQQTGNIGDQNPLLSRLKTRYFGDIYARILSNLPYSNSSGKCNLQNVILAGIILSLGERIEPDMMSRILTALGAHNTPAIQRVKVFEKLFGQVTDPESRKAGVGLLLEMYEDSLCRSDCIRLLSRLAETETGLEAWLETLPSLLSSSSYSDSVLILRTMLYFLQRKNFTVEKSVQSHLPSIKGWSITLEEEERKTPARLISFIEQNLVMI